MRRISFFVAVLAVFPVLAGCGGDNNDKTTSSTSTTPSTASPNVNNHGTKDFSGESSGEVELDDNYFDPTVIQGKAGQKVTLELKNEGKAEHNFTLTDQNIDKDVDSGEDAKVSVTIPDSGSISFFCKYHKSVGMAGSLAVAGSSSSDGSSSGSSSSGSSSSGGSSGSSTTESGGSSGGGGY